MASAISFRIWVVAVLTNMVLFASFLAFYFGGFVVLIFFWGLFVSAIATWPAMFVLQMVIRRCKEVSINTQTAVLIILISSVACAVLAYFAITWFYGADWWAVPSLFFTTIISVFIGVFTQYKALTSYLIQPHSHEN